MSDQLEPLGRVLQITWPKGRAEALNLLGHALLQAGAAIFGILTHGEKKK